MLENLKYSIEIIRLGLDNFKSIFIVPLSGVNRKPSELLNTYECILKYIQPNQNKILLIGEGRQYYLSYLLSFNNIVLTIDYYRNKKIGYYVYKGEYFKINLNTDIRVKPDKVFKNSFDYIISWSVLEHIHKVDKALNNMYYVLQKEGIMFHGVDLTPHGIFKDKLEIINKIPNFLWTLITSRNGKINRFTKIDYIFLFKKLNLTTCIYPIEKGFIFLSKK